MVRRWRKGDSTVICPRCGEPGTLYVQRKGKRKYLYVVHYEAGNRRSCYLGPEDGYVYFSKINDVFAGIATGRQLDPVKELEKYIMFAGAAFFAIEKTIRDEDFTTAENKKEAKILLNDFIRSIERWKKRFKEILEEME